MDRVKEYSLRDVRSLPSWIWLALLLIALFAVRYSVPLSQRVLLWDDFFLLADSATMPRFEHNFLYTYLHFIPFLRLAMLGFMQLPLSWVPLATSLWAVFWVCWLVFAFFRLARLYGIAPVPTLLGIAFIVFNPMLAEVVIWLTSTFYLVALVFTVEGLVQLERALKTNRVINWIGAGACALLAPCAWSTGYITAILYLVVIGWDWRRLPNRKSALLVLAFAFLAYPAVRILGEYVAGHTYLSVTPWSIPQLALAMLKIIGDGLVLGSLGLWRLPQNHVSFATPLIIGLTLALGLAFVVMYWRWPTWRKQIMLAAVSIVVALAIPIYFRGTQFAYADFRWFIRYFTTPLFGLGLVIAVATHRAYLRVPHVRRYVVAAFSVMILVSFVNKMPEHYVGGGNYKNRFRSAQTAHLKLVEQLSKVAHAHGVGAQPLINEYHVPIEGALTNFNGAGFYRGFREPNEAPISVDAHRVLTQTIRDARMWEKYQKLSFAPEIPDGLSEPKGKARERFDLPAPVRLSHDIRAVGQVKAAQGAREFVMTGGDPYITYAIPADVSAIDRVLIDVEIPQRQSLRLQVALGADGRAYTPSVFVNCRKSRCTFDVPVSRLVWFPAAPSSSLRIDPDGIGQSDQKTRIILHSVSIVPVAELVTVQGQLRNKGRQ